VECERCGVSGKEPDMGGSVVVVVKALGAVALSVASFMTASIDLPGCMHTFPYCHMGAQPARDAGT
jgi:hypothetical protein